MGGWECLCAHLVLSRSRESSRLEFELKTDQLSILNRKKMKKYSTETETGLELNEDRVGDGDTGMPGWLEDHEGLE